jgi:hypothetical protein
MQLARVLLDVAGRIADEFALACHLLAATLRRYPETQPVVTD